MQNKRIWIGIAFMVTTMGCLPPVSLNPLHATDDDVDQPDFYGAWQAEDDDSTQMIIKRANPQERSSSGEFDVVFTEKGHAACLYIGHLVRFGHTTFWDLEPVLSEEWKDHPALVAAHLILRASVEDDVLQLAPLEEDWFKALADIECAELPVTEVDDRIVLTASTDRLREFIAAHAEDPEVFAEDPLVYRRVADTDSSGTASDAP